MYETGTQLYDAWRFSHGETDLQKTSSNLNIFFDMVSAYRERVVSESYGEIVGDFSGALDHIKTPYLCSDRAVDEALNGRPLGIFVKALHDAVLLNRDFWLKHADLDTEKIRQILNQSGVMESLDRSLRMFQIEPAKKQAILEKLEIAFSKGPYLFNPDENGPQVSESKFLQQEIVPILCGQDLISPVTSVMSNFIHFNSSEPKKRISLLHTVVDANLCAKNPQPVGLTFCSGILRAGESECGDHAITIVGRRQTSSKVEYLLKNSWGSEWCKTDPEPSLKYEDNCLVWVSDKYLAEKSKNLGLGWYSKPQNLCGKLVRKDFVNGTLYYIEGKSNLRTLLVKESFLKIDPSYETRRGQRVCVEGSVSPGTGGFNVTALRDDKNQKSTEDVVDIEQVFLLNLKK
ncbi:hypothetical protein AZI86_18350 [Bdellovibrio bacteriovorus]|uniref:Uncharacterized protein n=2 Tax=Bdellovibrio bacteriovorus TaxID=959 RepID=A0A150WEW6_BDEBC|nr:hypothetical protein AZI86_18350 [Bdellovibrio bacteriovorus]